MSKDLEDIINHLNAFEIPDNATDPVCLLLCVFRQPGFNMKVPFSGSVRSLPCPVPCASRDRTLLCLISGAGNLWRQKTL